MTDQAAGQTDHEHGLLGYTVDEVAALLHRSAPSVYADVACGRLPAIKWGEPGKRSKTFIPRAALEQFLTDEAFRQQAARAVETGTAPMPDSTDLARLPVLPTRRRGFSVRSGA